MGPLEGESRLAAAINTGEPICVVAPSSAAAVPAVRAAINIPGGGSVPELLEHARNCAEPRVPGASSRGFVSSRAGAGKKRNSEGRKEAHR